MKSFDFSNDTLLLAEDNETNRLFVEATLKDTGITILYAGNGREAIKLFKQYNEIDIVLMDAVMPQSSGFDATIAMKKINPNVPVIMLTAYPGSESFAKSLSSGCNDFLSKPIEPDVLLAVLKKWLTSVSSK